METFLTNFKFIIGFIVLVFLVQIAFGDKMSERFTLLTLFTMVILNAESFGNFLKDTFSVTETNTTVDYSKTGANGMPSDVANYMQNRV
jgi:predicted histidine transporter YuiF (NhaC family)